MGERRDAVVVGVDFGTLGGRAVVARTADGQVLGRASCPYSHGVLDTTLPDGVTALPPEWALHVPGDYLDVLGQVVGAAVREAGVPLDAVVGIGIDCTSCTVLPLDAAGRPLCERPDLARRPHAYPKLWKHHAAQPQATRLTAIARERREPWLRRYGGAMSSETAVPKALQILEEDPQVYAQMAYLVEIGDWLVSRLCGNRVRGAAAAGYKGFRQGGQDPSVAFLAAAHRDFADFATTRLWRDTRPPAALAGALTPEGARLVGLPVGVAVAVAAIDAHVTPPAAGAVRPGQLTLIMGTSTCHLVSATTARDVPGVSGVVDGGIVPGLWGYEAGQSGVGDVFAWFAETSVPPAYHAAAAAAGVDLHQHLSALAGRQPVGAHGLVALDWHNGNRSVLIDHDLSGAVIGQTLATRPEDVYRALIEATAYGTRVIIDAFESAGVEIGDLVVAGGLTKNALLLQIYADVTDRRLSTMAVAEGSAVGAAIHAAVAAGAHPDLAAAAAAMGRHDAGTHTPIPSNVARYAEMFEDYLALHDHFGREGDDVMRRLKARRRAVVGDGVTGGS